nr:N-6 DNA methylase [Candidatus Brachybacter algidus]
MDARHLGHLINRRTKEFSHEDIDMITDTYHRWRNSSPSEVSQTKSDGVGHSPSDNKSSSQYEDIPGFCVSAPISKVAELEYVLTPGRYVGLADDEDDFNFEERFTALKSELEEQLKEEILLNEKNFQYSL